MLFLIVDSLKMFTMNTTSNNLEVVYRKDSEGATYAVGQSIVAGAIIDHHLGFTGNRMANLKLFSEDDIILITYPKSGKQNNYREFACCMFSFLNIKTCFC